MQQASGPRATQILFVLTSPYLSQLMSARTGRGYSSVGIATFSSVVNALQ